MNPFWMSFVAQSADVLTTALIHFVWQATVLTLILLVTVKLLDVKTARLRYLLSVGTLLAMGIAPIVTATLHHRGSSRSQDVLAAAAGPSSAVIENGTAINMVDRAVAATPRRTVTAGNLRIEVYVLIAWLAGVFILGTRLAIGFGFTVWIRANVIPLSDEFERRVAILGDRLRVNARQRVFACVRVSQAVAVGFIRPIVLIPASWLTQFDPKMIEAIIAHELAHIRRGDLWVNLAQRIIETLLFYHPAVWWLSSRISLEREMCCDEIAAECLDRMLYAHSLESVAKLTQGNLLMATSINGGKNMKLLNRIRYLLGLAPADAAGNWWAIGLVALVLPIAAVIALSLSAVARRSVATAGGRTGDSKTMEKILLTRPEAKSVTMTQQYSCQIRSHRHINVRSLEKGHVEAIVVRAGQAIKEGDLMFKVVPIHQQEKREIAQAEAQLAQLESKKLNDNIKGNLVSSGEMPQVRAKLATLQAKENLAIAKVIPENINAPFDGIVDGLHHQRGSLVDEGEVLATLSDNSMMWVYFNVSEARYLEYMAELNQHREDLQIELMMANGHKFDQIGRFGAIEADFNTTTGNVPFRADFPNPELVLRHGQTGTVRISRVLHDAIVIPQRTTFEVFSKRYVYVVDNDDVAHQREVVIQNEIDDLFVVKTGIGVGDRIILEGIRQVHDGEKVHCEDHVQPRG